MNTECVTEQLMNEIALCVAVAGLQMLDPQNAFEFNLDSPKWRWSPSPRR